MKVKKLIKKIAAREIKAPLQWVNTSDVINAILDDIPFDNTIVLSSVYGEDLPKVVHGERLAYALWSFINEGYRTSRGYTFDGISDYSQNKLLSLKVRVIVPKGEDSGYSISERIESLNELLNGLSD